MHETIQGNKKCICQYKLYCIPKCLRHNIYYLGFNLTFDKATKN